VTKRMNEDAKIKTLYPDIFEAGGLLSVIRTLLENRLEGAEINGLGTGHSYAHVRLGDKSSQVFLGLEERCFLFDFWCAGNKQASGASAHLDDVAASVEVWLKGDGRVEALVKACPFVRQANM
jgi:hypothetical protein